jgi:hypothetical protein
LATIADLFRSKDWNQGGTVSNVASRLCDEAKPGQILISPRVLMKVENAVKVEPVGEFELKGIRRPLAAYNVVAAQSSELEANDSGDQTVDFLSLGERWSMSNFSLKRNCRIQNKPTQLKSSNSQFRTQKLVLRFWW